MTFTATVSSTKPNTHYYARDYFETSRGAWGFLLDVRRAQEGRDASSETLDDLTAWVEQATTDPETTGRVVGSMPSAPDSAWGTEYSVEQTEADPKDPA